MNEIIDLIDNAIADYSTSGDAMRWTPDAEQLASRDTATVQPMTHVNWVVLDETHLFQDSTWVDITEFVRDVEVVPVPDEVRIMLNNVTGRFGRPSRDMEMIENASRFVRQMRTVQDTASHGLVDLEQLKARVLQAAREVEQS